MKTHEPTHAITDNDFKVIRLWLITSVGIFIALVLNLLEPFGIRINGFMPIYHAVLSTYGLVSALTVWLVLKFLPHTLPFPDKPQFILRLVIWMAFLVFMVSLSNWLYSQLFRVTLSGWLNMYVPVHKFSELMPQFLAMYLLWGLLTGVFIYLLLKNSFKHQSEQAQYVQNTEMVLLNSDNQSDGFKVQPTHLVCLKTSDNYLEVYYLNEHEELQHRMIRSSMKKMADSLDGTLFFRPHQSYLINLAYVKGLKKVQNNHFLEMAYLDFDVAISRKNVRHMKAHVVS